MCLAARRDHPPLAGYVGMLAVFLFRSTYRNRRHLPPAIGVFELQQRLAALRLLAQLHVGKRILSKEIKSLYEGLSPARPCGRDETQGTTSTRTMAASVLPIGSESCLRA
jgi:hypothetical protein